MWITSSLSTAQTPTNIALGNFDGVHLGHQAVLTPILPTLPSLTAGDLSSQCLTLQGYSARSSALPAAATQTARATPQRSVSKTPVPTVLTFYPHPREFFSGGLRPALTPVEEKAALMAQLGIQQLILLPFNQALADLSPQVFVEKVLLDHLCARHISVGSDFQFGHNRTGDVALLKQLATARGVTVTIVDLAQDTGARISSSRIRQALSVGNIAQTQPLLGRSYRLIGRVAYGQQLGRQLGFPTANLQIPSEKYLPRNGVYAVRVYGMRGFADDHSWPGVMNLGIRPTVDGQTQTVEVHLLDWQGDLYGCLLAVELVDFLRPEQRFESLDALKTQIYTDCQTARRVLSAGSAVPTMGDHPESKA